MFIVLGYEPWGRRALSDPSPGTHGPGSLTHESKTVFQSQSGPHWKIRLLYDPAYSPNPG